MLVMMLQDPKRHLEEHVNVLMTSNIVQCLGAMLHTVVFKWISLFRSWIWVCFDR